MRQEAQTPSGYRPVRSRTTDSDEFTPMLRTMAALPAGPGRATVGAQVVTEAMPLVRSLAARYRGEGEPLEDLVQAGALASVKAVDAWRG